MGKQVKDTITTDELARLLGLPSADQMEERNRAYIDEMRFSAEAEAGDEEAGFAAEEEAQQDIYKRWKYAVENVAEKLFGHHGLELDENKKENWKYKIIPQKTWDVAAGKIVDTINGVGFFHFNSIRDFLDSGPYTARQAVLSHLNVIKDRPRVYGDTSPDRLFQHFFE